MLFFGRDAVHTDRQLVSNSHLFKSFQFPNISVNDLTKSSHAVDGCRLVIFFVAGLSQGLSPSHFHETRNDMSLSTMIFFVNLSITVSPYGTLSQLYNRHG